MRLPLGLTEEALTAAAAEPDPTSLAAGERLRDRFGVETARSAVAQVMLRRRAVGKFGPAADFLFFTSDGLEQATRPDVARHHATRFRRAGVQRVVDLGCGIGTDALAFLDAGLQVLAVERDRTVAEVARANLGGRAEVVVADAEAEPQLLDGHDGVFCDPARRTARGRSWRVEDLSPSWAFVARLLAADRATGVKLGPGLPRHLVPAAAEAEWVSHAGDTVEVGLWTGPDCSPGTTAALVLPDARLVVNPAAALPVASEMAAFLYEPNGAVIRAGGVPSLGALLGARLVHRDIAYLTGDDHRHSPFATAFAVGEVFGYTEKALRRWVHDHGIGSLEIKTRGLDLDPAELRRRLRLAGSGGRASVVLTRTETGKVAIAVERLS